MDGYMCGGDETLVFYPESAGRFPVAVYGHGAAGLEWELQEPQGIGKRLETLASLGFVVVAPKTGRYNGHQGNCNAKTVWRDLDLVIESGDQHVRELIGEKADFEKLGLWGYSMGAKAAPMAVNRSALPVRALVASHGARDSDLVRIPSFYITANNDNSSSNATMMRREFNRNQAENKVFVEIEGIHEEPLYHGSMMPWIGSFFLCHLNSDQDACNAVYGSGTRSLCSSYDDEKCVLVHNDPDEVVAWPLRNWSRESRRNLDPRPVNQYQSNEVLV